MKQPKDYPLKEWLQMADDCECGAPREVMITALVSDFLDVTKRVHHAPGCSPNLDQMMHERMMQQDTDFMSWEFNGKTATFGGVTYPVMKGHVNGCPCLRCWRLTDFPIILFLHEGLGGELAFCQWCVEKFGMLKMMVSK